MAMEQGTKAVLPVVAGLEMSGGTILLNAQGITDGESRTHPIAGAASANWVLGHILTVREFILGQIGVGPVFDTSEQAQVYHRGASGQVPSDEGEGFEGLTARFARVQEQMIRRLNEMAPEELEREVTIPVPAPHTGTLNDLLILLILHDSYHAGQLGLLRRALGKEGAIR